LAQPARIAAQASENAPALQQLLAAISASTGTLFAL